MQIPFFGGSYEERSANLNAQRSINCYPVIDNKEAKNVLSMKGTPGLDFFAQAAAYGDSSDGAGTISENTTLTKDMQYSSLTVNAGVTLNTAGFMILCAGTLTNNGTITDSTSGGSGGAGGTGFSGEGGYGAAGTATGAGTGGDGGHGRGLAGVGGTGGQGGGSVRIFARTLTNNGTIHANGFDATDPTTYGDGANGGDGGTVSLFYDDRTVGTVTATGGSHSDGIAYGIDSYTKLMLLCTETSIDDITDSSDSGHTITATNAVMDTATGPFSDVGSVQFDYDATLVTNSSSDLIISGDFCFDFWIRLSSWGAANTIFTHVSGVYEISLVFYPGTGLKLFINGGTAVLTASFSPSVNQWYHIAVIKGWNSDSDTYAVAIDGTGTSATEAKTFSTAAAVLTIRFTGSSLSSDVRISQFRVSIGTARWTEDFTVPAGVYAVQTDGSDGDAGTTSWTDVPYFAISNATIRGGIVANNKLYIAVGANILAVTTAGVMTYLGQITTSTGNVFMAFNGTQILIVDGTAYGHYIPIATDVLTDIDDADFPAATSCCFLDGYFIVTKAATGQFYVSGLYDVTTWDATQYATAESNPDNLTRCFSGNGNLWLFGSDTAEVWYNSGGTFPFSLVQGADIEDGINGAASVCQIKDQLYFLSGRLEVLRTSGYQREKISTTHIDKIIQEFTTTTDAVGYEYRADGHIFFVLTFPTESKTLVYDITTDYWHEWQSYITAGTATYARHRGAIGFYFNKKYIVGDHTNGKLYALNPATYTDNGEIIKRTRRSQIISKEQKYILFHSLQIDMDTGIGIGGSGTGSDPTVTLYWSDDGCNTWSDGETVYVGEQGEYETRAVWRRLGKARNRVFELTMSQPCKFNLLGAYAELEELKA